MSFEPHRSLLTALRTLTILRLPGRDASVYASALPWFPLAGLLIGALVAATAWAIGGPGGWALGAGAAGVLVATWVTGGLHVDGLGDTADAMGGAWTPERRLAIMKDTHCGAMAVMAIGLSLILKTAALAELAAARQWVWILLPFVVSRLVQVQLAVTLPYARAQGTGAVFVKEARRSHVWLAAALALGLAFLLAGRIGLVCVAGALALGLLLAVWMRRFVGGVTGDLLGFGSEVTENVVFFALALLTHHVG